jgi:hypothetical protein
MRRAVVLCGLLAGCGGGGGVSNHDPARYGSVTVMVVGGSTSTLPSALTALDALGPDFRTDGAGVVVGLEIAGCAVGAQGMARLVYTAARQRLRVELCALPPGSAHARAEQQIIMHGLGHVVGMGHVDDANAILRSHALTAPGGLASDWSEQIDDIRVEPDTGLVRVEVTQADIDEFKRTHP